MTDIHQPAQLGFDKLLNEASVDNQARTFARKTAHLPATIDDAVPFFLSLLEDHNVAMLAANSERVFALREEAHLLARRLNGGKVGIFAGDQAPGCLLPRLTAAALGEFPLWGQTGDFRIEVAGIRIRIEMDGLLGIGASAMYWPNFEVHWIDDHKPFISETGYWSFMGVRGEAMPNMTPADLARVVIEARVDAMKGRLVMLDREHLHADAS